MHQPTLNQLAKHSKTLLQNLPPIRAIFGCWSGTMWPCLSTHLGSPKHWCPCLSTHLGSPKHFWTVRLYAWTRPRGTLPAPTISSANSSDMLRETYRWTNPEHLLHQLMVQIWTIPSSSNLEPERIGTISQNPSRGPYFQLTIQFPCIDHYKPIHNYMNRTLGNYYPDKLTSFLRCSVWQKGKRGKD